MLLKKIVASLLKRGDIILARLNISANITPQSEMRKFDMP